MTENKTNKLPRFGSIEKTVEFFDSHDLGDYLEQMPAADFEVDINRRSYIVTLNVKLVDKLSEIAKSKQTPAVELVNMWVREKILEAA